MKLNKFEKYLEYKISQIDKRIETIIINNENLREKVEKVITKDNIREFKSIYDKNHKKNIFNLLLKPNKDKLVNYYVEEKSKEYNKELEILTNRKLEYQEALESFKDGFFTIPFHPCNETLNLYLKFASKNKIPSQEFVNQILLLMKLNTLLYDNKTEHKTQMKSNLSSLYDDYLNLKEPTTIKTVKFILKKIFQNLIAKNEQAEEYLNQVLEEYTGSNNALENNKYKEIIKNAKKIENIQRYKYQYTLKKYMQLEEDTILTKEVIANLSEEKLKIISTSLELAKTTNNKNLVQLIKKAIEDIISMEKYNAFCQTENEQIDNEDIVHTKIETLKAIVETYKNPTISEETHYFLKDLNSPMPGIFNDIKTIDIINYGQIMELLLLLKNSIPKQEIQRVKNYPIYKTIYDNIVIYYTIKDNKIYIIKLGLLVYQEKYDTIDFNIYFEEINKRIDHSIQKIYAAIIEKELDITFYKKEANILLKSNQDI